LPRRAAALVRKLQHAGLDVQLQDLTSETAIPTIGCTITDAQGPPGIANAHSGCGTHPDARIALTRALTEAAQSRLTCIQGGREDLPDLVAAAGTSPREQRSGAGHTISFSDIASVQHLSVGDDVEFILERMRQSGFEQAVVVDLTRTEVGIPVVRVIVPRAEVWTVYFAHGGRASPGTRALQLVGG
jgi:ribosomal protein S12 methylthiotransferase accessory factor